jgi:hypothetical protein
MNNDAIKRAHAKEIHPSQRLVDWQGGQLSVFPPAPVNEEIPEQNALLRVTYGTINTATREVVFEDDLTCTIPLSGADPLETARSISTHDGVVSTALYELYSDFTNCPVPSIAWSNGTRIL